MAFVTKFACVTQMFFELKAEATFGEEDAAELLSVNLLQRKSALVATEMQNEDLELDARNNTSSADGAKLATMLQDHEAQAQVCSTWESDSTMYTCATLPSCCDGYAGKGISADTVQCVPASWEPYEVVCATCSTWESDDSMYSCETLPTCCDGYTGKGITADTVQCVPASWEPYDVVCDAAVPAVAATSSDTAVAASTQTCMAWAENGGMCANVPDFKWCDDDWHDQQEPECAVKTVYTENPEVTCCPAALAAVAAASSDTAVAASTETCMAWAENGGMCANVASFKWCDDDWHDQQGPDCAVKTVYTENPEETCCQA